MVRTRVNSTSWMEPRMDCDASNATASCTAGGISRWNCGSSFRMLSTTSTVLVPGCRWMARITPRVPLNQADDLVVFHAVDDVAELLQPHRRAVAPGHDQRPVGGGVRSTARSTAR